MPITPLNGDLTAGVAGRRTDTINPYPDPWFTGDAPAVYEAYYDMPANLVLVARQAVGFDGNGLIVPATQAGPAGVRATGTLTFSGVGTEGDTVTVGARVYTLSATILTANTVLIGATATITATNLVAAINATPAGMGVTYGPGTQDNASSTATSAAAVVTITARVAGAVGNSIVTTEAGSGASFGAATLTGGTGGVFTGVKAIGFTVYAADSTGFAAGARKCSVYRGGVFNPDLAVWDDSFITEEQKRLAFEGSPSPTAILMRKPQTMQTIL